MGTKFPQPPPTNPDRPQKPPPPPPPVEIITRPPAPPPVQVITIRPTTIQHVQPIQPAPVIINMQPPLRWHPVVAAVLSLFLPGLGQLYKGQPINGLVWFLLTAAGYVCFIIPGLVLHLCCVIGAGIGDPTK